MPSCIFDQLIERLKAEREALHQALHTARETKPRPIDFAAKRILFSDAVSLLEDPDSLAKEQNLMLKQCIERITYNQVGMKRRPLFQNNEDVCGTHCYHVCAIETAHT